MSHLSNASEPVAVDDAPGTPSADSPSDQAPVIARHPRPPAEWHLAYDDWQPAPLPTDPDDAPPLVLLVENDPGDLLIIQEAVIMAGVRIRVLVAKSGEEALAMLRSRAWADEGHPPALMLIDLNLPEKSGFDVLAYVKNDERLKTIPVVMVTGSSRHEDIELAYRIGANSYLIKPMRWLDFADKIKQLLTFWFSVSKLPR